MNDEQLALLSALIDGEAADPEALAAILEVPAGRAALVDFARLRRAFAEDDARPDTAAAARMRRAITPPLWRRAVTLPLPAAAALAAAALTSLWLVIAPPSAAPEQPPAPSRILYFEPGVDWH